MIKYPFSQRDFDRYGIEIFQRNGIAAEVWDCTPFINPSTHKNVTVPDPVDWAGLRTFETMDQALAALSELGEDDLIMAMIVFEGKALPLYKAIRRHGLLYAARMGKGLPEPGDERAEKSLLSRIRRWTSLRKIKKNLCIAPWLPAEWQGYPSAGLILAGGEYMVGNPVPMGPKTEILWTHTFDYDAYLAARQQPHRPPREDGRLRGVFLGGNGPLCPDVHDGKAEKRYLTVEGYFPPINRFLDELERQGNAVVTVAAHPRFHMDNAHYFAGRKAVWGETVNMVRDADFVVAFASTSISFPILFGKPIIFITTDEFIAGDRGELIDYIAGMLGKTPVNVSRDEPFDFQAAMRVDEAAYARYINTYIKKAGSPELPFWQIVADRCKSL
ncbi:MAG: hypothetical protein AB7E32_16405 [Desulfovibrio sp.]